jgi:trk system potassium uptake protein TrkH
MKIQNVLHVIGAFLCFLALSMIAPLAVSLIYRDGTTHAFLISMAVTILTGGVLWKLTPSRPAIAIREGFAVVTFSWISMALFGSLPFLISGHIPGITDAFFETMSGFTTTGATILEDIEIMPRGLLFWRSLIQWLGGMGIIVLSIAVLPLLGVGGMQLFKAEVPGPTKDKLSPRVRDTAKILWGVYVLLSGAQALLLVLGGMGLFDALCHTFTTMATGGFSNYNDSVGHFQSPFIQYVFIFFMIMAGVNFSLHFRTLRGDFRAYRRDGEFVFYLSLILIGTLVIGLAMGYSGAFGNFEETFRHSLFQTVSIMTTTGYVTADYEYWPFVAQAVLFLFMFVGGCAGSTGGSIKNIRILLLLKATVSEIRKLVHPHAVIPVRIGGVTVSRDIIANILGFFFLYILIFVLGFAAMAAFGLDKTSAMTSVAATLGNIGPGFGAVGPAQTYAHLPLAAKWLMAFFMLTGRLEIFTVMVLFSRTFWRV